MVNETKKTNYSRVIDSQLNTASEARWQIHHKYESLQEQMFTVLLHLFNYKNGTFKHRHSTIAQKHYRIHPLLECLYKGQVDKLPPKP